MIINSSMLKFILFYRLHTLLLIDSIKLSNHVICQHSINVWLVFYTKYYTSIMKIIIETLVKILAKQMSSKTPFTFQ